MKDKTIQINLFDYFMEEDKFTIPEATEFIKEVKGIKVNNESIRARIYEGVDRGIFKKISRGVYSVSSIINGEDSTCLLINGDGRDLSMIPDHSIDGIVTDHPYDLKKALSGGNRKFAEYELFRYEIKDFKEKQRVLKPGAFLVEFLPEESSINYEYLYQIKKMAEECGLFYFAKVEWKKGNFVSNTGRKAKNIEDVLIFSNGNPRSLRLDTKKNLATAIDNGISTKNMTSEDLKNILLANDLPVFYMRGTNGMLPTQFDYQPSSKKEKVHAAEKPVELLENIISYISLPYETLLDHFAGSGNFGIACFNMKRNSILIEKDEMTYKKMEKNIQSNIVVNQEVDVSTIQDIIDKTFANEKVCKTNKVKSI